MACPPRGRAKHGIVGALFVLLAAVGLAPSPARADCGHDATSKTGRSIERSLSDLELLRYSAADAAAPIPSTPGRDRPCSGPSCSRGQGLPQAPSVSFPVRNDQWCLTSQPVPPLGKGREPGLDGDTPLHPCHFAPVPERPPRPHHTAHAS